jgi:glutamine amidotransferase
VTSIAVVDHGAGNLVSIARGLETAGAAVTVATGPAGLEGADGVVLPGVGATAAAMDRLRSAGFVDSLRNVTVPLLGICVGLQVLFESSDEDGAVCLGLLDGRVEILPDAPLLPHIGWNDVTPTKPDPLFAGIDDPTTFYFVHSYAAVPADVSTIVATTVYGRPFAAAVRRGSVAGVQFHPERSGPAGLAMLANFVGVCRERGHAA